MIKLTDLIKTTNDITEAAQPSQFAMHAFTRDQEGLLTYTKALWANTSESIELTDGSGLAFNSLEDFISGYTPSGTFVNNTMKADRENANKTLNSKTFYVRVTDRNTSDPKYVFDGTTQPTLFLEKGVTYTFNTDDASTQGFSLYISAVAGDSNYVNEFINGVSYSHSSNDAVISSLLTGNNTVTPASLIFTVPFTAPDVLYYSSGENANCFGIIQVSDASVDISRRRYDQVRFDNQKLTYYISNNGFLVARYVADYSYS